MKKRSKILVSISLMATTVLTGCGVGNIIFPKRIGGGDVGNIDDPELKNKFMSRPNAGQPLDLMDVKENLFIAAGVLNETSNWKTAATGKVQAKVGFIPYDQQVVSRRIINNTASESEYFFETNTISAFVKKAEQRFINKNSWLTRVGSNPSMTGANYNKDNIKAYSETAFIETYGGLPNGLSNYVLNDLSVVSGEYIGTEDGLHNFEYLLDAKKATAKYAREVKFMSDASDYPSFKNAKISISIDDNWVIHKAISIDSYDISLMGGLRCNSTLIDEFSYNQSYIDIAEKGDFAPKFGSVDVGEPEEKDKTAMDYLTEAAGPLMTSTKPISAEISVNANGSTLPIYLSLDLVNMVIKASIADRVYFVYKNDQIFVSVDDKINLLVKKDELLGIIAHYIPGFSLDNISLESLLASDLLGSAMDDMVLIKEAGKVILRLEKAGAKIDINLKLNDSGSASFDTFDIEYLFEDKKILGSAALFTADHKFKEIPANITEFTNLVGLAESIDRFLEAKSVAGDIYAHLSEGVTLQGGYTIDYNDLNNILALINLDFKVNGELISFELRFVKDSLYLIYGENFRVRVTLEESKEFFLRLADLLGLSDTSDLESLITSIKDPLKMITDLIQAISAADTGLSIGLDLTTFNISENVILTYAFATSNFEVTFGKMFKSGLVPGEKLILSAPSNAHISGERLQLLFDSIFNFAKFKKFDLKLSLNDEEGMVNFVAGLDLNKKDFSGNLAFDYASIKGSASFCFKDNEIFFNISNKIKALLTPEELIQLSDKLKLVLSGRLSKLLASLPKLDMEKMNFSIKDVLDSMTVGPNGSIMLEISLDGFGISGINGTVFAAFNYPTNSFDIAYKNLNAKLSLSPNLSIASPQSEGALRHRDLETLLDDALAIGNAKSLNFSVLGKINGKDTALSGHFSTSAERTTINLTLKEGKSIVIDVIGKSGYFDILGMKLQGRLSSAALLAKNILESSSIVIPELNSILDSLIANKIPSIATLLPLILNNIELGGIAFDFNNDFTSFSYKDRVLSLGLQIDGKASKLRLDCVNQKFSFEGYGFNASFNYSFDEAAFVPLVTQDYLDLNVLGDLSVATFFDMASFFKSQGYKIELRGVQLSNIKIDGTIYISLADKNDIKVRLDLDITYNHEVFQIFAQYKAGVLYLSVADKLSVVLHKGEISSFVDKLISSIDPSSTSKIDVLETLSLILGNFNHVVKGINVYDSSLKINFDLSSLGIFSTGSISYTEGRGVAINTSDLGEILISRNSDATFDIPMGDYLTYADLENYATRINDFINSKSYEASFDLGLIHQGENIAISGDLVFEIEKRFSFNLKASISTNSFFQTIEVNKFGDKYYVDLGEISLVLSTDEIFSLIGKLNVQFGLGLGELDSLKNVFSALDKGDYKSLLSLLSGKTPTPFAQPAILPLLSSLVINREGISYSIDTKLPALGVLDLKVNATNSLAFSLSGNGYLKNLVLVGSNKSIIDLNQEGRLNLDAIEKLLAVYSSVSEKKSSFDLSLDVNGLPINGHLLTSFEAGKPIIEIGAFIDGYQILFNLVEKTLYVDIDGAKIKIEESALTGLLTKIKSLLPNGLTGLERLKKLPSTLDDVLKSFTYKAGRIEISLMIDTFNIALSLDINGSLLNSIIVKVASPSTMVNIALTNNAIHEFTPFDPLSYFDLSPLSLVSENSLGKIANDLVKKVYDLSFTNLHIDTATINSAFNVTLPPLFDGIYLTGQIYIDLTNIKNIKVNGSLSITFNKTVYDLVIDFKDEVITIEVVDALRFQDSITNIKGLIQTLDARFHFLPGPSAPQPAFDFKPLIKKVLANFNLVLSKLETSQTGLSFLFDLKPLGYFDQLSISLDSIKGLDLSSNQSGSINLLASDVRENQISSTTYYLDSAEILDYLNEFDLLISGMNFEVNFATTLNLGMGPMLVAGNAGINLDAKFDFYAEANLSNKDFHVFLKLHKIGEIFYVDLGTVHFALSIDDMVTFVNRLESEYGLGLAKYDISAIGEALKILTSGRLDEGLKALLAVFTPANTNTSMIPTPSAAVDLNGLLAKLDIKSILQGLIIEKDHLKLTADLNAVDPQLGNIVLDLNKASGLFVDFQSNSLISEFSLGVGQDVLKAPIMDETWLGYSELLNIITKGKDILGFFSKKQFDMTAAGTIYTKGVENYSYQGTLKIDMNDVTNFKVAANATVVGPKIGKAMTHNVSLVYENSTLYGIYNGKLRFKMTINETLQLVRYATDLMGIKSDILSSLLDGVTEGLGGGVFDPVMPEVKPMDVDVNKFLQSVLVEKGSAGELLALNLKANCEQLYSNLTGFNPNYDSFGNLINPENSILTASIDTDPGMIKAISVKNIYSRAGETFDINLSFNDVYTTPVDFGIAAPSDAGIYFDFGGLKELLKQFINTANVASYSLSGEIHIQLRLMIGSWNLGSMFGWQKFPIKVNIELDENSVPTVHVNINITKKVSYIGIVLFQKGMIDIYFSGDSIYVRRDTEYRTYKTSDFSNKANVSGLVKFIMKPSSMIESSIDSNMDSGFVVKNPILFEDILTKYSYGYDANSKSYEYKMNVAGSALMEKNLGDVAINSIKTQNAVYMDEATNTERVVDLLNYIDVQTTIMNMLDVRVSGNLTNVYPDRAPSVVDVVLPPNLSAGTGW